MVFLSAKLVDSGVHAMSASCGASPRDSGPSMSFSAKKNGGGDKGIALREEETLTLVQAGLTVCQVPAIGAQQSSTQLGRRLQAELVRLMRGPANACTLVNSQCALEKRLWEAALQLLSISLSTRPPRHTHPLVSSCLTMYEFASTTTLSTTLYTSHGMRNRREK